MLDWFLFCRRDQLGYDMMMQRVFAMCVDVWGAEAPEAVRELNRCGTQRTPADEHHSYDEWPLLSTNSYAWVARTALSRYARRRAISAASERSSRLCVRTDSGTWLLPSSPRWSSPAPGGWPQWNLC